MASNFLEDISKCRSALETMRQAFRISVSKLEGLDLYLQDTAAVLSKFGIAESGTLDQLEKRFLQDIESVRNSLTAGGIEAATEATLRPSATTKEVTQELDAVAHAGAPVQPTLLEEANGLPDSEDGGDGDKFDVLGARKDAAIVDGKKVDPAGQSGTDGPDGNQGTAGDKDEKGKRKRATSEFEHFKKFEIPRLKQAFPEISGKERYAMVLQNWEESGRKGPSKKSKLTQDTSNVELNDTPQNDTAFGEESRAVDEQLETMASGSALEPAKAAVQEPPVDEDTPSKQKVGRKAGKKRGHGTPAPLSGQPTGAAVEAGEMSPPVVNDEEGHNKPLIKRKKDSSAGKAKERSPDNAQNGSSPGDATPPGEASTGPADEKENVPESFQPKRPTGEGKRKQKKQRGDGS